MDRNTAIRRCLTAAGRVVAGATSIVLATALPAPAAQLEQHNDLVNTYITTMHADPLVADCAAHGNFVASTSSVIDHVEFSPQSFDSTHATVTPWNDSFDEGKQRVKVDTVVSVDGVGIPQDSNGSPIDLKFRCGYVGNQMLAFSWNDPVAPARARSESAPPSARASGSAHGKHASGAKGKGKHKGKASSGKSTKKATPGKSAHKPSAGAASKVQSHAKKAAVKKAAVTKSTQTKKKK
jgi:hypothetical protein